MLGKFRARCAFLETMKIFRFGVLKLNQPAGITLYKN